MSLPPKPNPFPGLRPFTQEEDHLFFGREEQTLELLQRLGEHRFVAVVGTSGSGKSSLVRCGLLSELQGGKMRGAGAAWEIAVTHPGGNPLGLLTEALLDAELYDRATENARENLLATLSRSHFGLVEAVKQAGLGADTNFLLVVDQFEEVFRFHEAGQSQQEMANEFVSLLLEAAAQKEVPIYIVLTMRSDFIGDCGQFEGLAETVNRGEFLIPRLTREQYKRVIEGPIKVAGGQIAPRLLQRLLNDLGQQADQLPCLQHALMRTWDVRAERGTDDALDLEDYQRVGRMAEALSLHADEIYAGLETDRQRQLCGGLFRALTVQESENRGIRRPQRLGRLCQILDVPADELSPIIDAYRRPGVTFLMPPRDVALNDQTVIDISHESLMRVWTRLRSWVEEEAQASGIYLRLSESAALHAQGKAGLYRDPELGIALAWRDSRQPNAAWAERYRAGFDAAMAFLKASQAVSVAEDQARDAAHQHELEQARELAEARQLRLEQQQRGARKLRRLIAGVAVVALVACVACVAAVVANRKAKDALAVVESQKTQVEASLSKAEAAERLAQTAVEEGRELQYTTDMQLAPFVWKDDRTTATQMRVLLAKHVPDRNAAVAKPDLRGFEWRYFQNLVNDGADVFAGHDADVLDGTFTASGQLETLQGNGQVRSWDPISRTEDKAARHRLPGTLVQGVMRQVRALSLDGRLVAQAIGTEVQVFDTATGKQTIKFDSARIDDRRLIFSRDPERLVIVDDKIRWCDPRSGEVVATLDQRFDRLSGVALSADGATVGVVGHGLGSVVGHGDGRRLSAFRLDATARTVTPLARDVDVGATIYPCALSPDGRRIVVATWRSGVVNMFDTATGQRIPTPGMAHSSSIWCMAFSADGTRLATADEQGTIHVWADGPVPSSNFAAQQTLKGHSDGVTGIRFSSDGKRLVSTSVDKTARVWALENAGVSIRQLERTGSSSVARFSPDGRRIATVTKDGIRLWDAATGRLVRELSAGDDSSVDSVAFSPTDPRLLATGHGGRAGVSYVALWDLEAGTELARLPGATDLPGFQVNAYNGRVSAMAFSPDGKYLVSGFGARFSFTREGTANPLKVWEVATRRLDRLLEGHIGYCISINFSKDGTLLASTARDGTAIVWSARTWQAVRTLREPEGEKYLWETAFSPDMRCLAMAVQSGNVLLWDIATGKPLETLRGHSNTVTSVSFSPDGRTLASGSWDQTVRLWNVRTRRELMRLDPGNVRLGPLETVSFSPDGKHLMVGGRSGTALWSAARDPG